jgi:hypothetical protein
MTHTFLRDRYVSYSTFLGMPLRATAWPPDYRTITLVAMIIIYYLGLVLPLTHLPYQSTVIQPIVYRLFIRDKR